MRFNKKNDSLMGPVLRSEGSNSNYINGSFEASFELNSPDQITVEYTLVQGKIETLLKEQQASLALAVHCEDTYFYEMFDLSTVKEQKVSLPEGHLMGNVYFTLVVKAMKPIKNFKPEGLRPEFHGLEFDIRTGDFLAVSDEFKVPYQLSEIWLGAGLFTLNLLDELEPNEINIDLTDEKIAIGVGTEINRLIQTNSSTKEGKQKNMAAVYFPAIIEVLHQIKAEDHNGKGWFESVGQAMKSQGHDIAKENWDPFRVAQELLRAPYVELLEGSKK